MQTTDDGLENHRPGSYESGSLRSVCSSTGKGKGSEEVQARITGGLSDCEESVRHKILWENAQKLYKVEGPSAADEARRAAAVGA